MRRLRQLRRLRGSLHTLSLTYSIRRYYVDEFMFRQVPKLLPGSLVLDLGGHKEAKRGRFDIDDYPLKVVAADLSVSKSPDVQADALRLPFANENFDAVICAELLEHVPDPKLVLAEIARSLRPGGLLLITVPFLFHIHADPYDFGRYTDHYWLNALTEAGFAVVEVERQGLFFAVLLNQVKQYLNQVKTRSVAGRAVRAAWTFTLAALWQPVAAYERQSAIRSDPFLRSFTTGFGIVARKDTR